MLSRRCPRRYGLAPAVASEAQPEDLWVPGPGEKLLKAEAKYLARLRKHATPPAEVVIVAPDSGRLAA